MQHECHDTECISKVEETLKKKAELAKHMQELRAINSTQGECAVHECHDTECIAEENLKKREAELAA